MTTPAARMVFAVAMTARAVGQLSAQEAPVRGGLGRARFVGPCAESAAKCVVETEASIALVGDRSPDQARVDALRDARLEAVRMVVGTRLTAGADLRVSADSEHFDSRYMRSIREFTSGRVTDFEVLADEVLSSSDGAPGATRRRVRIRATVTRERGTADLSFRVSASLNRQVFEGRTDAVRGDSIEVRVTPSARSHLYVIQITGDSAEFVVPNQMQSAPEVEGGTTFTFPSAAQQRQWRLNWPARSASGRAREMQWIVALATKRPVAPPERWQRAKTPRELDGLRMGRMEFERWLVEIPLNERALLDLPFEVVLHESSR